ncbi:hypothetical protein [Limosilactobacillus oris]|uniref:hypothetical protein n=1 Tax=Limosilactobacillus oris TaxID=1632 RepID=UPI00388DE0F9
MATIITLIQANKNIYLLTIVFGALIPLWLPTAFHSEDELSKYSSKITLIIKLLWKDMVRVAVLGLVVVTLLIGLTNYSKTFHNPLFFFAGMISLIIWALVYIELHSKRK